MAVTDEAIGFSIGVLASRTGVTPGVLRTWDTRFGFPAGRRSATGHRRFTDEDVDLVREVLDVRATGLPLQVAIDAVRRRHDREPGESVHAVLARDFPHLAVQRLGRRALVAVSHAVEDEALARADRPLVLGTFQQGHRFVESQDRWEELARTASWAAVVADFEALPADPASRPARCQLADSSALRREWTVVTVSATRASVLSAWEVPGSGDATPVYESVISTHRPAVIAAARVLLDAARAAGATPPAAVVRLLDEPAPGPDTAHADVDRMWLRALAHLDRSR